MTVPFESLSALEVLTLLTRRLEQIEADVKRLEDLMGPLKHFASAPPGKPQTPLEMLGHIVGILQGRIDQLNDRVWILEGRDPDGRIEKAGWP